MTVTDAKDLPACPFCASTNLKVYFYEAPEPDAFVQCGDCATTGPTAASHDDAVAKWGKRDRVSALEIVRAIDPLMGALGLKTAAYLITPKVLYQRSAAVSPDWIADVCAVLEAIQDEKDRAPCAIKVTLPSMDKKEWASVAAKQLFDGVSDIAKKESK